jgi:IS1 family transposase
MVDMLKRTKYYTFMNKLSTEKRAAVVAALVEGNSIRATARMTNVSKPTILKLLADLGTVCGDVHDQMVRNVTCKRIQMDEIWSFVGAKQKNVPQEKRGEWGDLWTWVAIDADTKLIVSYLVGPRIASSAFRIVNDLSSRVRNRPQITTDGLPWYGLAIDEAFTEVDFAKLTKIFEHEHTGRYSPSRFIGERVEVIKGSPDPKHISTSYVERNNLTMRMSNRRMTRLTNAFSKKGENHAHAVALNFLYYNFARIHRTLRITPAMAAGISDHVWSLEEIVGLLDTADKKAA